MADGRRPLPERTLRTAATCIDGHYFGSNESALITPPTMMMIPSPGGDDRI